MLRYGKHYVENQFSSSSAVVLIIGASCEQFKLDITILLSYKIIYYYIIKFT